MAQEKNNFFTVIIPTHDKRGKLLARAIRSVLNQTYPHFELLIIDDHSTDDIEQIVKSFKDERIRYIKLEGQGNRYFAQNAGMRAATQDYICLLDSDDEYLSIYLECFNDAINENPEYKVFNCGTLVQHNKKEGEKTYYKYSTIRNTFKPKEEGEGHIHFGSGSIGQGQFVFHRSVLDAVGYLPEARTWWDAAEMSGIPGYGREKPKRCLGNPWGNDFYLIYKITRKFKMKSFDLILYVQHCR